MEQYYHEENFGYLVVKTFDKKCYGFNLKRANECAIAKKIIQDVNNFIVNGWKVARHIPKWINSYKSWNDFINEHCSGEKNKENYYEEDDSDNDDKKDHSCKDEEEGEEDKEEEKDKEEEAEEEEEEKVEEEEVEEELDYKNDGDIKISMKQGDSDCNSVSAKRKKMSPIKNEKKTDDDVFDVITEGDLKKETSQHVVETVKSNSEDDIEFKSICGGNLRKKIAENNTFKSILVDIHITGPFRNKKTGKSHLVIVHGDSGKTNVLKPQFIWKYLSCLLLDWEKIKNTKVNITDHCYTYYEIGIQKYVFGIESKWKHHNSTDSRKQGAPVKRLLFVYSSENNNR